MQSYFGKRRPWEPKLEYFDMDIINDHLSMNDQILVLPKFYGTLDSDFESAETVLKSKIKMCKNFDRVQYLHWSAIGKPWYHSESSYVQKHEEVIRPLVQTWYRLTRESCPWMIKN